MVNAEKSHSNLSQQQETIHQLMHNLEDEIYKKEGIWTVQEMQMLERVLKLREIHGWADWEFTNSKNKMSPEERFRQMNMRKESGNW